MKRLSLRPNLHGFRLNLARVVLATLAFAGLTDALGRGADRASAADDAGAVQVLAPPGTPGGGQPLAAGGSARTFQLQPPVGAACAGDTATDGYRVQSFMVPESVDLDTLTFDPLGPAPQGIGASFRQPLFFNGQAYVSQATAINNGLLVSFPGFSFDLFGSDGPSILPEGTYRVGYACTLGPAGPEQLDRFWSTTLRIIHDPGDSPAGLRWEVGGAPPASTTTTTTVPPTTTTISTPTTTTVSTTTTSTVPTTTVPTSTVPTTTTSTVPTSTVPTPTTSTPATTTTIVTTPTTTVPDDRVGSQGIDTTLPATDSQVTVSGRGRFSDLEITVNQTEKLTNQAVSVSWTGGVPTVESPGRFGSEFLQIMQCWGDDDGTVPDNPGPPPEQCVQGAVAGQFGGIEGGVYPNGFALSRVISRSTWDNFDPGVGTLDPDTTNVWRPFVAVDGTVVDVQTDPSFNPAASGGNFWLNPYFNIVTTNEVAGAVTGIDGAGNEIMQVLTGIESTGLGCGQRLTPPGGGDPRVPQCWIVVVPRGEPAVENAGTPYENLPEQFGVFTSPLSPGAWENRIAIPIEFNPVDSPCSLGEDERRLAGSELALPAVASWQPVLCETGELPPYSYASVTDATARQQIVLPTAGSPGMVVTSQPIVAADDNPVVYAPLTASGLVIGFNVERFVRLDAPEAERQLDGVRVAELNLTPRLVAKLLTQSYSQQVQIAGSQPEGYDWVLGNPKHLAKDPDFLQFNREFELLDPANGRTFGGLIMPSTSSDAARQVWDWIFADPEAAAWLAGEPDEWGMVVNPVYATSTDVSPFDVPFGTTVPSNFPKSDPYCYQAPARGVSGDVVPAALCGTDWLPYARSFEAAAQTTRTASVRARIIQNPFAINSSQAWSRESPQFLGRRSILAVVDTPSAATFGVQTARLSRAGDNGADRVFIAPDDDGLAAGVEAMVPSAVDPLVLVADPAAAAPDAYPLTMLTYAASAPLTLDDQGREEYAAFVDYAVGEGQNPGLEFGDLPPGYVPLPEELVIQAEAAAGQIRTLQSASPTTTTTTVPVATTAPPQTGPTSPTVRPRSTSVTTTTVTTTTSPPTSTTTTTTAPPADGEGQKPPPPEDVVELTAGVDTPVGRMTVPALSFVVPMAAWLALEITKRPRRELTVKEST